MNVATLSRGYKRKSRGYVLADDKSNVRQIGDEPYGLKNEFPNARVAVDENRCHGIEQLMKLDNPNVEVVLLDDALPTSPCKSRAEHSTDRFPQAF